MTLNSRVVLLKLFNFLSCEEIWEVQFLDIVEYLFSNKLSSNDLNDFFISSTHEADKEDW